MKVLAINGSPRKGGNTVAMLKSALEGVVLQGAETELIHLYDINFKGCISCLACKDKNGKSFSKCAQRDELTPVLEKMLNADALLFGSPIYFGSMSAGMQAFYERAAYPFFPVNGETSSLFPKKLNVALIITISADEKRINEFGMSRHFEIIGTTMGFIFGASESLVAANTNLYKGNAKYDASNGDTADFINNRKKAFDMGVRLLEKT